jgi:hypothetical protein
MECDITLMVMDIVEIVLSELVRGRWCSWGTWLLMHASCT